MKTTVANANKGRRANEPSNDRLGAPEFSAIGTFEPIKKSLTQSRARHRLRRTKTNQFSGVIVPIG